MPPIVSAIIDGAQALSMFLHGVGAPPGNDPSVFTSFFVPRAAAYLAELQLGASEVQESSRMASDAGILVHKLLPGKVRARAPSLFKQGACTEPLQAGCVHRASSGKVRAPSLFKQGAAPSLFRQGACTKPF